MSTRSYSTDEPIIFHLTGDVKMPTIFHGRPTTHKVKNRWNALHAHVMRKAAELNPDDTPENNVQAMDKVSDELTDFVTSRITRIENADQDGHIIPILNTKKDIRMFIDGLLDNQHEDLVSILMDDQKVKALTFRGEHSTGTEKPSGKPEGRAAKAS